MSRFADLYEEDRHDDPAISLPTPCRYRETARTDAVTLKSGTRTFYCTDCNRLVYLQAVPEETAAVDRRRCRPLTEPDLRAVTGSLCDVLGPVGTLDGSELRTLAYPNGTVLYGSAVGVMHRYEPSRGAGSVNRRAGISRILYSVGV